MHWLPDYLRYYGVDILDKKQGSLKDIILQFKQSKVKFNCMYEEAKLNTIKLDLMRHIKYCQNHDVTLQKIKDSTFFPYEFKNMFIYSQLDVIEVRKLTLQLICMYLRFVSFNEDVAKSMTYQAKDGWIRIINHYDDVKLQMRNQY